MYEDEIWKPITKIVFRDGREILFEGYDVSNYGRIRTYKPKYGRVANGNKRPLLKKPYIISGRPDSKGYIQYNLSDIYLKRRNFRSHTLVMQTFYGPPEGDLVICHYDDIKNNNHIDNLRYDTQKSNIEDKIRNSTKSN
jgi:hypothetical protein